MVSGLGEFDRIERYLRPLARGAGAALDLRDDAAVLATAPETRLVVTTDAMVEDRHYLRGEPADRLARKLLRVNLSDLAAMGADPLGYTLTLALPHERDEAWLATFAAGLAADQAAFGLALLGGDSVATFGETMLSVTMFGTVPTATTGALLLRSGARPGDRVWVSGTVGDAALGLPLARSGWAGGNIGWTEDDHRWLTGRYHLPTPRVALGRALRGIATAAIDISDGLFADAGHVCAASGVAMRIEAAALPHSLAARAAVAGRPDYAALLLAGGDDYELLFTTPAGWDGTALAADLGLALTPIGQVAAPGANVAEGVVLVDAAGQVMDTPRGWDHYSG